MTTTLGEYGLLTSRGREVVTIATIHGHTAEIRRLWKRLDRADGPAEDAIIRRLDEIGAIGRESHPDGCSCGSPECPAWISAQEIFRG